MKYVQGADRASSSQRNESDQVVIQSGVEHGVTLGTPISLFVPNKDQRPHDYSETDLYPRPSHADWTYLLKYGVKASSGGGRSSARETIGVSGLSAIKKWELKQDERTGRVAAGAIAEKYLKLAYGVEIVAFVSSVGKVTMPYLAPPRPPPTSHLHNPHLSASALAEGTVRPQEEDLIGGGEEEDEAEETLSGEFMQLLETVTREKVDKDPIRCPHELTAKRMTEASLPPRVSGRSLLRLIRSLLQRIVRAKQASDSIGGTVTCVIRNCPPGLGEPCFDKLEALLGHAMLSIPATKGFEIGSGFRGTEVAGSKHNDMFVRKEGGGLGTVTNRSGGVQGGISNGEHVYFRSVALFLASAQREH